MESSIVQPPSTQSVDEMRTPSGLSCGHASRTAANTSMGKRIRLSNDPPYASFAGSTAATGIVEQVAVRTVQLDCIETETLRTPRRLDEIVLDLREVDRVEHRGQRLMRVQRNRRRRDGQPSALGHRDQLSALPRHLRRTLAARMRQLDGYGDRRCVRPRDGQTFAQCPLARVVVETETAKRNATNGRHRGGLDREHASARLQQLAPVHGVPVGRAAVDGRVLAHGRYDDAVGEGKFPELER